MQTNKSGSMVLRAKMYLWACAFAGMGVLVNPVAPIFTPAGNLMLLLFLVLIAPIVKSFSDLIDGSVTLYPNVITEPYLQSELLIPTPEWAVI